jgi:hypothetical protein
MYGVCIRFTQITNSPSRIPSFEFGQFSSLCFDTEQFESHLSRRDKSSLNAWYESLVWQTSQQHPDERQTFTKNLTNFCQYPEQYFMSAPPSEATESLLQDSIVSELYEVI